MMARDFMPQHRTRRLNHAAERSARIAALTAILGILAILPPPASGRTITAIYLAELTFAR